MRFRNLILSCMWIVGGLASSAAGQTTDLISQWRAEGDALDSAGENHGTLHNGAGFAPGFDGVGQAFSFDGVDDHILVPDSPSLNPLDQLTLEAWVYITGKQGADRDIVSKDGETAERQYLLTASRLNRFRAHVFVYRQGLHVFDGATPVELDRWYHVRMTYDGFSVRLYVDGVRDGFRCASGPMFAFPQPVRIGGGAPSDRQQLHFAGRIDEVQIHRRALQPQDSEIDLACGGMSLPDFDEDGVPDADDNCVATPNPDQADADGDGAGDACDVCPLDADDDADGDGVCGEIDNCPAVPNSSQADTDEDGEGDACDDDDDGDLVLDVDDNCPLAYNPDQADQDGDGIGDACDTLDRDGDGVEDCLDLCPATAPGEVVDPTGCSVADHCPCSSYVDGRHWKNAGAYRRCVARWSESFVDQGLISEEYKDALVSVAAATTCGHRVD
jgi:hypothetical protein